MKGPIFSKDKKSIRNMDQLFEQLDPTAPVQAPRTEFDVLLDLRERELKQREARARIAARRAAREAAL